MQNYQKNAKILNMNFVFMFDHFKVGEQWHMCIWIPFKFKFGVNLENPLQCTSFKWKAQHLSTMNITLYHLIICLCIVHYVDHFVALFAIEYRWSRNPRSPPPLKILSTTL